MGADKDIVVGVRLTADGDQLVGEVKLSKKTMDQYGSSVDQADRKTSKLAKTAATAAVNIGRVAAATTAAAIAFSINKNKEFTRSVSDLSAITGATGDNLAYLTAQAEEFGATTTLSASQSVEAIKLIASAKPDLLENAAALAGVTKEAIALAEAAGITVPEAANTLGSSLNQFNETADQSSRFINVLAAGAKYGASEIFQTAMALKESGTVADGANISFEETNTLIQMLAGNAIKGAQAGTALRGVILKLQNQANAGFNPAIVGINTALQNLQDAELSTADKMKLFGLESFTAAEILINQADAVEELTAKLSGTSTAYEQASIRTNDLTGDMDKLTSVIEGVALAFGDNLNPMVRELIQAETKGLDGLRLWLKKMSESDDVVTLGLRIEETAAKLKRAQKEFTFTQNMTFDPVGWITGVPSEERHIPAIEELQKKLDGLIARRQKLMNIGGTGAGGQGSLLDEHEKARDKWLKSQKSNKPSDELVTGAANLAEQMDTAFLDMSERTTQNYTEMWAELVAQGGEGSAELQKLETSYAAWLDQHWSEQEAKAAANDEKEAARQAAQDERVISLQQTKFERLAEMAADIGATEEEREINRYDRQVEKLALEEEQLREALGSRFNMENEFRLAKEQALIIHQQNVENIEKKSLTSQAKLWQSGLKGKLAVMGQVMGNISSLMQTESRRLFEIGKVAAISEATVTGAKAILDAYAWGSQIGGPIGGAAAAAAAALPVGIQIAKISSARFGGGAASNAGASVSAGGASFPSAGQGQQPSVMPVNHGAGAPAQQQTSTSQPESVFRLIVEGDPAIMTETAKDQFADEMTARIARNLDNGYGGVRRAAA